MRAEAYAEVGDLNRAIDDFKPPSKAIRPLRIARMKALRCAARPQSAGGDRETFSNISECSSNAPATSTRRKCQLGGLVCQFAG